MRRTGLVWVLVLMVVIGIAWCQEKAIRDDTGETCYQSIEGEGLPTPVTADAYGRTWVRAALPVEKTPTFLDAVIIGTPGTPTKIAANDNTFCTFVVFQAGRAAAANASSISITKSNGNYSQQKCIELCPGDTWSPPIPAGTKWDLNDFYIDGVNTDDGVRVLYVAP